MIRPLQLAVCAFLLFATALSVYADTITFAPGQYDNTPKTVTGTNAAPAYNNNQTTGLFRDVFWWGTAYNGGTKGVGAPDFINSVQSNLISNGGTPARAVLGGDDYALNFTGLKTSGGASFLSIYDRLARWAQRRWELIGETVPRSGCLFAYSFSNDDVNEELEYMRQDLWLVESTH